MKNPDENFPWLVTKIDKTTVVVNSRDEYNLYHADAQSVDYDYEEPKVEKPKSEKPKGSKKQAVKEEDQVEEIIKEDEESVEEIKETEQAE